MKSMLDLTKKLDMATVAEGIETDKQMDFLRLTSGDLVQGYVISKPVPVREFEMLVSSQKI